MAYPFGDAVQGSDAALPKEEFARHLAKVQGAMEARDLDLQLVTGPENIFYVCGQQTPGYYTFQCLCIPRRSQPFLICVGWRRPTPVPTRSSTRS